MTDSQIDELRKQVADLRGRTNKTLFAIAAAAPFALFLGLT